MENERLFSPISGYNRTHLCFNVYRKKCRLEKNILYNRMRDHWWNEFGANIPTTGHQQQTKSEEMYQVSNSKRCFPLRAHWNSKVYSCVHIALKNRCFNWEHNYPFLFCTHSTYPAFFFFPFILVFCHFLSTKSYSHL